MLAGRNSAFRLCGDTSAGFVWRADWSLWGREQPSSRITHTRTCTHNRHNSTFVAGDTGSRRGSGSGIRGCASPGTSIIIYIIYAYMKNTHIYIYIYIMYKYIYIYIYICVCVCVFMYLICFFCHWVKVKFGGRLL